MLYCTKTLEQTWNTIPLIPYQTVQKLKMSWSKESVEVELGGLKPREVVIGVFMIEDFQQINDPLPDPSPEYGDLIKVLKVSNYFQYTLFEINLHLCQICQTVLLLYLCLFVVARGKDLGEIVGAAGGTSGGGSFG